MLAKTSYRKLLKTVAYTFKQDKHALKQARIQLKEEFLNNKNVKNALELEVLYKNVDELDEMLRFNIVQGEKNTKGHFGLLLHFYLYIYFFN
jgi:hypothetical protein